MKQINTGKLISALIGAATAAIGLFSVVRVGGKLGIVGVISFTLLIWRGYVVVNLDIIMLDIAVITDFFQNTLAPLITS